MKTFKFLAKQGQEALVCRLLTAHVNKPRVKSTENGILILTDVPHGMSKRSIDRMLFANKVPGARERKNHPILKGHRYDVMYKEHQGEWFQWVDEEGTFRGLHKSYYYDYGCDCCGGYQTLMSKKTGKVIW